MRTVSLAMLQAMFAPETDDYPILLLTITHDDLQEPIRVSSDPTQRVEETDEKVVYGTVSRQEQYVFFPFEMALPDDQEERAPRTRLIIDNVDREIVKAVRTAQGGAPRVQIEIVMASDPDTVEAELPDFDLRDVRYNVLTVEGDITLDSLAAEPFPAGSFDPARFPGLF